MSTQDSSQQTIEYSASMTGGLTVQDLINSLRGVDSGTEVTSITVTIPVEKQDESEFQLFPTGFEQITGEVVETSESDADSDDGGDEPGADDETTPSTTTVEEGVDDETDDESGSETDSEPELPLNEGTDVHGIMKGFLEADTDWLLREDLIQSIPDDTNVNPETVPNTLWRLTEAGYVEKRVYEEDKRKREYTMTTDGEAAITNTLN